MHKVHPLSEPAESSAIFRCFCTKWTIRKSLLRTRVEESHNLTVKRPWTVPHCLFALLRRENTRPTNLMFSQPPQQGSTILDGNNMIRHSLVVVRNSCDMERKRCCAIHRHAKTELVQIMLLTCGRYLCTSGLEETITSYLYSPRKYSGESKMFSVGIRLFHLY